MFYMTWQFILSTFLSPLVALLIGFIGAKISYNSSIIDISRERLEKVYHPLFVSIEPFLYKNNLSLEQVQPFIDTYLEIEEKHSLLIYPSLRYFMCLLRNGRCSFTTDKYDNNGWFTICDYVTKEYDKLCKKSHLPVRSIAYRINNEQYRNKYQLYLGFLYLNIPNILLFGIMLFLWLLLIKD